MNEFEKIIKSNSLQLIITLISMACLLLAGYITIRIAPLVQSQAVETEKVDAFIEVHKDDVSRNEFNQLNANIQDIKSDVRDIHQALIR